MWGESAGLAFLTLWVAGYPLGFNPLIGMAGLIGIALNDSIVVLAQIRTNDRARGGDIEAITGEVMKTSRHVLSTTLTTMGGFVPLLLSGGDFWPPLAIVIAGGVGGASVLALFFVPASYVLVHRLVVHDRVDALEHLSPELVLDTPIVHRESKFPTPMDCEFHAHAVACGWRSCCALDCDK